MQEPKLIKMNKYTDDLRQDGLLSRPYTMVSEIIDNAISSYVGVGFGDKYIDENRKTANGLKIEIYFDYSNIEKPVLTITDNAKGMSNENLKSAMEPGNRTTKYKKTRLNRYGVGLKKAAFWLGEYLEIKTKVNENESWSSKIDLKELDDKHGRIVEYGVFELEEDIKFKSKYFRNEKLEHGTQIIISDMIMANFDVLTEFKNKKFKTVLGNKYRRYIDEGMELIFVIKKDEYSEDAQKIERSSTKYENLSEWFENYAKKKKLNKDELFNEFIKHLNAGNVKKEIIEEIVGIYNNNEQLKWKYTIPINEIDNFVFEIGFLQKDETFKKYTGFNVMEMDRSICAGPNDDEDDNGMKPYNPDNLIRKSYGGDKPEYRITGKFDIDDLLKNDKIFLSDNKIGFQFKDAGKTIENNFRDQVEKFKKEYLLFAQILTKFQDKGQEANVEVKKTNRILSFVDNENMIVDENVPENKDEFNYIVKNIFANSYDKTLLTIIHISDHNNKMFIQKTDDGYDNNRRIKRTIIKVNVTHDIWTPLIKKSRNDDGLISIHKLVYLLYIMENRELSEGIDFLADLDKYARLAFEVDKNV